MQFTAGLLRVSEAAAFMLEHEESACRAGVEICEGEARAQLRRHCSPPQPRSAVCRTPRAQRSFGSPCAGGGMHALLDTFIATGERVRVSLRTPTHGATQTQWDSSTRVCASGNSIAIAPPVRRTTIHPVERKAKETHRKERTAKESKHDVVRAAAVEWAREKRMQERRLGDLDGFRGRLRPRAAR